MRHVQDENKKIEILGFPIGLFHAGLLQFLVILLRNAREPVVGLDEFTTTNVIEKLRLLLLLNKTSLKRQC